MKNPFHLFSRSILLIITLNFFLCLNAFTQNQTVIDSLKQVIPIEKQDTNLVKLFLKLGDQYQHTIPDTALFYYQKALALSKRIKAENFTSKCLNKKGIIHFYSGSYDEAIDCYLQSLKINEELGDKQGMAKCYNNISLIYSNQGSYDKSIEYFLKTFEISKEIGYKQGMAMAKKNIGDVYSRQGSYNMAIDHYQESLKIAEEIGDKKVMALCYNGIGIVYNMQGSYDKTIEYYFKALKIDEEIGNKFGMSSSYGNLAIVYFYQGLYDKSIEYNLKALKINEEIGNKHGMSACYGNIGAVHFDQKSYGKANEYYHKQLEIATELGDKQTMSYCYDNIGAVISEQGSLENDPKKRADKFDQSLTYFQKALNLSTELGDKREMATCYINIGNYYKNKESYTKAIQYNLKSLNIFEELGDKNGIANSCRNIASLNITLADSTALNENQKLKYLNEAVEYGNRAIELAKEINAMPEENLAANTLMEAYKKLGNNKKAMEYADIYITTKDSMFNKEKTKALTEMQVKYEAEKKQLQIEKMEKQKLLDQKTIEVQQAQNRKQLIIIFSSIAGFIIVLVFSIIILRMFRQKREANILLAQQNEEIKQQKEKISAQRDLATNQRDLIIEQKQELTDSIHYAYRIQSAVIPSDEYISFLLSDYFILYKPRDIVSGDFYWLGKYGNKIVILAADCTGHGVPGAFMSMLGVAFLNEIINKENITSPADILNNLRDYIIKALKQKGKRGESKDGMDVAAITIDTENNKLEYSGANNPLYIVKSKKMKDESELNDELEGLTEIKPNKQPVAIYEKMVPFTNHEINLQKNDTIYIFSDGYADQFGGPKGKKYKYKPFKRLLLENINKPMKQQKEILDKTFEDWKGELEQIDDVLVLGIKI